jgi:phosphonate transport system substrate-binding protein
MIEKHLIGKVFFVMALLIVMFIACKWPGNKDQKYRPVYSADTSSSIITFGLPGFNYYELYDSLVKYFNANLGSRKIKLTAITNTDEYTKRANEGQFDLTVTSAVHALQLEGKGYEIAGQPVDIDSNGFRGVIIVRKDSPVKTIKDLKHKVICFPDSFALAGTMLPMFFLHKNGLNVNTDIKRLYLTSQESSIMNVFMGNCDAGTTFSIAWEIFAQKKPEFANQLEVKWQTEHMYTSALVFRKNLDPQIKNRLKELFFTLHESEFGRRMLAKTYLRKYQPATAASYKQVIDFIEKYKMEIK